MCRQLNSLIMLLVFHVYAPEGCAQHRLLCFVLFTMSHRLSGCLNVLCQHGLVRRAGESTAHIQQWRHHMIMVLISLWLSIYATLEVEA